MVCDVESVSPGMRVAQVFYATIPGPNYKPREPFSIGSPSVAICRIISVPGVCTHNLLKAAVLFGHTRLEPQQSS